MSTDTESSQQSPGEMVREARKSLGLSLADVAAMTRIPKTMLKHLESDRYDEYSAEVFARGHLRNYAREVQLEPELVLRAFDRRMGAYVPESVEADLEEDDSDGVSLEGTDADGDGSFIDFDLHEVRRNLQPAHLVAVGLVLIALFVVFGVLSGKRATAQKTNEFPEESAATGSGQLEQETKESRWMLEQPNQNGSESSER